MKDYDRFDATALAKLVREKQVSPAELLDAAIARTEAVNPRINAVVPRHYDEARAAIRACGAAARSHTLAWLSATSPPKAMTAWWSRSSHRCGRP